MGRGCPHVRLTACQSCSKKEKGRGTGGRAEALPQFCGVMSLYSLNRSENPWVLSYTHTSDAEKKIKQTKKKKKTCHQEGLERLKMGKSLPCTEPCRDVNSGPCSAAPHFDVLTEGVLST